MKELQLSSIKPHLTRKNIEIATVILLALCALFTFAGRMSSKEVLTLDNGKIKYEGYVVSSKMNGQGKLTFENGDTYEGEFSNGIFNGKGTYKSAQGWTYTGQFKNGYADGKGKLTTEGQATYEGTFKQGIYQHAN